jgi:hypothetical protein
VLTPQQSVQESHEPQELVRPGSDCLQRPVGAAPFPAGSCLAAGAHLADVALALAVEEQAAAGGGALVHRHAQVLQVAHSRKLRARRNISDTPLHVRHITCCGDRCAAEPEDQHGRQGGEGPDITADLAGVQESLTWCNTIASIERLPGVTGTKEPHLLGGEAGDLAPLLGALLVQLLGVRRHVAHEQARLHRRSAHQSRAAPPCLPG